MGALLEFVRAYYDSCNRGDADGVAARFTPDAVHYYTRMGPARGAQEIGRWTAAARERLHGHWAVEHGIEDGEQACIEWSMTWQDPGTGELRIDRGTEWFSFRDGRISEVRCYHHSSPRNRAGELVGFDHAGRGDTTPC
jgi:ketosteroid isomerase-like protein